VAFVVILAAAFVRSFSVSAVASMTVATCFVGVVLGLITSGGAIWVYWRTAPKDPLLPY